MEKPNCWEINRCGREPGGGKIREFGVCPASIDERLNGVHEGRNAGRACWIIAGTLCEGQVQGTFAHKFQNCRVCAFYKMVQKAEGCNFQLSILLMNRLRGRDNKNDASSHETTAA